MTQHRQIRRRAGIGPGRHGRGLRGPRPRPSTGRSPSSCSTTGPTPSGSSREARAAAQVIHPNCVPIFDIGEHDGSPFLVMELVAGMSASEFLERRGALRWKTATRIVAAACRGLAAVHEAGIVHRDVKPSNLLISKAAW